jgi:ubiquinone/menaquinone biosynthesis C-methylase UbiE
MQKAPIDENTVKEFYNNEYYKNIVANSDIAWHYKHIATKLGNPKKKKILDIACGTGEWLYHFSKRGAITFGIDISEAAISHCKKKFINGEFSQGSAEKLPFEDNYFDIVTCMGSLEHFPDKNKALMEMARVSKKEAKILILVPNSEFLARKLGLYDGTNQKSIIEEVKSITEWEDQLKGAGLEIEDKWKDLHTISFKWIFRPPKTMWPIRIAQALLLPVLPLKWQYQVYFLCSHRSPESNG